MPSYDTAATVIGDAAVELGLVSFSKAPSDPFVSTDPNIGQLCQLLKSCGRELVRAYGWSHLRRTHYFNTSPPSNDGSSSNQALYGLPRDFERIVDQTAWNRDQRLPMGELSPQNRAFFKARLVGVVYNILFEVLQGQFSAYPDLNTPSYNVSYDYISKYWVVPSATLVAYGYPGSGAALLSGASDDGTPPGSVGNTSLYPWNTAEVVNAQVYRMHDGGIWQGGPGTTGTRGPVGGFISATSYDGSLSWTNMAEQGQDSPTLSSDYIMLDSQLMSRVLKRDFLRGKGMPSQAAEQDAIRALERAQNSDKAAPVLRFNRQYHGEPLLGDWNLPLNGTAGQ